MRVQNKIGSTTAVVGLCLTLAIMAFGAVQHEVNDWGKDNPNAVKNCVGTHTNGNCAHLPLDTRQFKH